MVAQRQTQLLAQRVIALKRGLGLGQHRVEHRDQFGHRRIIRLDVDRGRDRGHSERQIPVTSQMQPLHQPVKTLGIKTGKPFGEQLGQLVPLIVNLGGGRGSRRGATQKTHKGLTLF